MRDCFLWNNTKTGSVRASRIRNFTIVNDEGEFKVVAWANDEESVKMGAFESEDLARAFLQSLHKQIESIHE